MKIYRNTSNPNISTNTTNNITNIISIHDPAILTPLHINRSISNLNKNRQQRNNNNARLLYRSYSDCGGSSFAVMNNYMKRHQIDETEFNKSKYFLTPKLRHCNMNVIKDELNSEEAKIERAKRYNNHNYLYNKIFLKIFKKKLERDKLIDNRLNLFYAENEMQFEENFKKINIALLQQGKKVRHPNVKVTSLDGKIDDIKDKITFMKGVSNYSYPSIIIKKIEEASKIYSEERKMKQKAFIAPYEKVNMLKKELNRFRTSILSPAITVKHMRTASQENKKVML